ncbi:MAG: NTP transferase domain-containing protein [Deltaproteobacteria bacterium]|nr:NTP transferase domain-containing protein [Deltaproteobacteria bacterium]
MLPAMVLCAGFGTRLRPLTDLIPKPMLTVGDRPAVLHTLAHISDAGLTPVVLNTHHRADVFEGTLPQWVRVVHEPSILGTAGGVANASGLLGSGDILVWNGDILAEPDLRALIDFHHGNSKDCVATLLAAPRAAGQGTLGLDASSRVVRMRGHRSGVEQIGADFMGIQLISARLRARLPAQGCLVGDAYLPALQAGDQIAVCMHRGDWDDIGTPRALLDANLRWLRRHGRANFCELHVPAPIELHETVVCNGAMLRGAGSIRQCLALAGSTLTAPAHRAIALPDGRVIQEE